MRDALPERRIKNDEIANLREKKRYSRCIRALEKGTKRDDVVSKARAFTLASRVFLFFVLFPKQAKSKTSRFEQNTQNSAEQSFTFRATQINK